MKSMEFWEWMNKKYIEWRGDSRSTISEFAEFIGVNQPVMSSWTKRKDKVKKGKRPNASSLAKIAAKLGFEVYDVLGLPRPLAEDLLSGLPPEFRDPFLAAYNEIRSELVKRGITENTPAAKSIISEVFAKYGVNFTLTEK